jgi:hypothetical protein
VDLYKNPQKIMLLGVILDVTANGRLEILALIST